MARFDPKTSPWTLIAAMAVLALVVFAIRTASGM